MAVIPFSKEKQYEIEEQKRLQEEMRLLDEQKLEEQRKKLQQQTDTATTTKGKEDKLEQLLKSNEIRQTSDLPSTEEAGKIGEIVGEMVKGLQKSSDSVLQQFPQAVGSFDEVGLTGANKEKAADIARGALYGQFPADADYELAVQQLDNYARDIRSQIKDQEIDLSTAIEKSFDRLRKTESEEMTGGELLARTIIALAPAAIGYAVVGPSGGAAGAEASLKTLEKWDKLKEKKSEPEKLRVKYGIEQKQAQAKGLRDIEREIQKQKALLPVERIKQQNLEKMLGLKGAQELTLANAKSAADLRSQLEKQSDERIRQILAIGGNMLIERGRGNKTTIQTGTETRDSSATTTKDTKASELQNQSSTTTTDSTKAALEGTASQTDTKSKGSGSKATDMDEAVVKAKGRAGKGPSGPKRLSEKTVLALQEAKKIPKMLGDLRGTVKKYENYFGPLDAFLDDNLPISEKQYNTRDTIQSQIDLVLQTIGKLMEGGVLRKEDEDKYKRLLPVRKDTPTVAQNKVDIVQRILIQDILAGVEGLGLAGYDVAWFDSSDLTVPESPLTGKGTGKGRAKPTQQKSEKPDFRNMSIEELKKYTGKK